MLGCHLRVLLAGDDCMLLLAYLSVLAIVSAFGAAARSRGHGWPGEATRRTHGLQLMTPRQLLRVLLVLRLSQPTLVLDDVNVLIYLMASSCAYVKLVVPARLRRVLVFDAHLKVWRLRQDFVTVTQLLYLGLNRSVLALACHGWRRCDHLLCDLEALVEASAG